MEFDSAVRNTRTGTISIKMNTAEKLIVIYPTSDPLPNPEETLDCKLYIASLAKHFETYSKKWLSAPIFSMHFLKNYSNEWNHGTQRGDRLSQECTVRQVWCPTEIQIKQGKYTIFWTILTNENMGIITSSGQDVFNEIPYAQESEIPIIQQSLRSLLKKRIRKARIKAAGAKWKLNELLRSYLVKYGTLDGVDKESELSSEIESDTAQQGEVA
jgi:hypothetical protein